MRKLTLAQILAGTRRGATQSAGLMDMIPLLPERADAVDETLAPPAMRVGTSAYGTVEVWNLDADRPTLIPTGAGWVVKRAAQDHAVPSAAFLEPGAHRSINTAMCVQDSQGGYLGADAHPMLILPAQLRTPALAVRHEQSFSRLWGEITALNGRLGVRTRGHLHDLLDRFAGELATFVAQLERVPDQLGAIVLVGGELAGVERAPSPAFWAAIWEPLIRVCYGALAVEASAGGAAVPKTRVPLRGRATTLAGLAAELQLAELAAVRASARIVSRANRLKVEATDAEERLADLELTTAAGRTLSGQLVTRRGAEAPMYASLVKRAA